MKLVYASINYKFDYRVKVKGFLPLDFLYKMT